MVEKVENKLKKTLLDHKDQKGLSIISLIDDLVEEAQRLRASDIHIDPQADSVRVRYRIDGVMADHHTLPKTIHSEVITRIKILSGLRTDEHQSALDGRFRLTIDGTPIDIRVSIAPAYYGENAVLRLLSDKAQDFTLTTLGFSEENQKKILSAIQRPYGMILATGPTGSGKTTTLYTLLKKLSTPEVSIITIEDPIEYSISGINQIQANTRTGLTFAQGLRSILRQDPNIIMVGEIRDAETAGIAVNTALTGHLLLSTLHTNDAATTLPRLLDMKIEPYLIASTVNIAIGQRLMRKICEHCKKELKFTKEEMKSLHETLPLPAKGTFRAWRGGGCDACAGSGYRGRLGIHEVMVVDEPIRQAVVRKATATELRAIAVERGMITMLEDAVEKVAAGLTTIDEVMRMLHG